MILDGVSQLWLCSRVWGRAQLIRSVADLGVHPIAAGGPHLLEMPRSGSSRGLRQARPPARSTAEIFTGALLPPAVARRPTCRRPESADRSAGTSSRVQQRPLRPKDVRRASPGPAPPTPTPHERSHRSAHRYRSVRERTSRNATVRTHGHRHQQGLLAQYADRWLRTRAEGAALSCAGTRVGRGSGSLRSWPSLH